LTEQVGGLSDSGSSIHSEKWVSETCSATWVQQSVLSTKVR